jgi:carbon-monoxide dehydrogenase medium subunit
MQYLEPKTIAAAVKLMQDHEDARCLAGGQTLVAMMNAGLVDPTCLISLRKISGLDTIRIDHMGALTLGAMVTHARIAMEPRLRGALTVVREAAAATAHPAVRNMGTIGGTLCHADPAADHPAAVVAADAEIEIAGPHGLRVISAEEFFVDYLSTALEAGEVVTAR